VVLFQEVIQLANVKDVFSVARKATIVTGGGTGIGIAIAREFALREAPVLIASRNAGHLEPVRDEIRKVGGTCEMMVCDVRDAAQCDALIAEAVKHFGKLDVMINNHGASITAPSMNLSANAWRTVVEINLDGTFHCSKAAARQFIAQKSGGCIINLGSTAGVRGSATMLPYAAAKAAIVKLTESHAAEWGHHQIRVNCIAPGPVNTAGAAERIWPNEAVKNSQLRARALGRFGVPADIAYPCVFVASEAASWMSGATIVIDGGNIRDDDAISLGL
jgi:NAD(P)-dependent dehydrogenase (short-subunit alcohol dehydrogenase family)